MLTSSFRSTGKSIIFESFCTTVMSMFAIWILLVVIAIIITTHWSSSPTFVWTCFLLRWCCIWFRFTNGLVFEIYFQLFELKLFLYRRFWPVHFFHVFSIVANFLILLLHSYLSLYLIIPPPLFPFLGHLFLFYGDWGWIVEIWVPGHFSEIPFIIFQTLKSDLSPFFFEFCLSVSLFLFKFSQFLTVNRLFDSTV